MTKPAGYRSPPSASASRTKTPKPATPEQIQRNARKEIEKGLLAKMTERPINLSFQLGEDFSLTSAEVLSEGGTGEIYDLDFANQTCSCDDGKSRISYPKNHTARLCKHLFAPIIGERRAKLGSPSISRTRYDLRRGPIAAFKLILDDEFGAVVVMHQQVSRKIVWIDVYVDDFRYGWSIVEKRWSHGNRPTNAAGLRGALKHISEIRIVPDFPYVQVAVS